MADVKPIRPEEVGVAKAREIPSEVFATFNAEITRHYTNGSAKVYAIDVLDQLVSKGMKCDEILNSGWLNIEEAYHKAGWKVTFDKPDYAENYRAFFTFARRQK